MSRGINKAIVLGYIGRDPEMRYTPAGKAVTNFSVAVTEKWGPEEDQSHTEWFACEAWGKPAEILNQYLHKGSRVYLEGRLRTDKWEKDGATRFRTKLVVDSFLFLSANGSQSAAEEPEPATEESFGSGEEYPF
jgi:single-strand DNA-binding protein